MTRKKRDTPKWQWEQALLDAYYDHRWREVLDPLYEKFQRWKAGELSHADRDEAIHRAHKQNQEVFRFFAEKRDWLVKVIQWDAAWFDEWVKANPLPSGVELMSRPARLIEDGNDKRKEEDG